MSKRFENLTNERISAAGFTGPDNIGPKMGGGVNDFEMTILATWSRRSIMYGGMGRKKKKKRKRKKVRERDTQREEERREEIKERVAGKENEIGEGEARQ